MEVTKGRELLLCELHFEKDCIARNMKAELLGLPSHHKKLKDCAVPTIFTYKAIPKKRKHSVAKISHC